MATSLDISIQADIATVRLRSTSLQMSAPWNEVHGFLQRMLAVPEVTSINLDRRKSTATLSLVRRPDQSSAEWKSTQLVRSIAQRLRTSCLRADVCNAYSCLRTVQLKKVAAAVVGGQVVSAAPGRMRIKHPLLIGSPALGAIVGPMLARMPGVSQVGFTAINGTLLILHGSMLSAGQLLTSVERLIARAGNIENCSGSTVPILKAAGCLGLATATQFVMPGLLPVAAAALVLCNLPMLAGGVRELATLRLRLPALYTVIMGTTLISGQVLAAALMQSAIVGWYWWSNRQLQRAIHDLLSSDEFLRVEHAGQVSVSPGGIESMRYMPEATQSRLIPSLAQLMSEKTPTARTHDRAALFVPLTFVTGAAAIATMDISALAAVLRPDFATGPSMAERMSLVTTMHQLLERGWFVSHPEVLLHTEDIDTVVVVDTEFSSDTETGAGAEDCTSNASTILTAKRHLYELKTSRTQLSVHRINGAASVCASYVDGLSTTGKKVAVCGSCEVAELITSATAIKIVPHADRLRTKPVGDIIGLPEHCELEELWDALIHRTQSKNGAWPVVLACNLASVAGAFVLGFTSLHVVILTNIGTWAAYRYFADRHRRLVPHTTKCNVARRARFVNSADVNAVVPQMMTEGTEPSEVEDEVADEVASCFNDSDEAIEEFV